MATTQTRRPPRFWVAFDMFVLPILIVNAAVADERGSWWAFFWAVLAIGAIYELVEWVEWLVREGRS